jgi:hypothetical protein
MTPEQVRAKEKLIAAYRSIISGMEAVKQNSVILVPGEKSVLEGLERMEALQEKYRETIDFLQAIPNTAEIFVIGPDRRSVIQDDGTFKHYERASSGQMVELPPEGPGITDPEWPDSDTE